MNIKTKKHSPKTSTVEVITLLQKKGVEAEYFGLLSWQRRQIRHKYHKLYLAVTPWDKFIDRVGTGTTTCCFSHGTTKSWVPKVKLRNGDNRSITMRYGDLRNHRKAPVMRSIMYGWGKRGQEKSKKKKMKKSKKDKRRWKRVYKWKINKW